MSRAVMAGVTVAGMAVTLVSAYYLAQDWRALTATFARFERLASSGADLRALFVAEAQQNVYRINCFAEGLGALLGLLIAAIGLHGLCTGRRQR